MGYWICIAILAALAAMSSLVVAHDVIEGAVQQFSKYGNGRVYHLSEDPGGFFGAIAGHVLFSGMFWWFAFWVWNWRIRGK
ncbi:hypothetical protein [Acidovorax sp. sif0732]|uniref:hypothetical protein n=2 Tax=unclassified Acidovorax TaxID=2684926 RepID=UPI001C44FE49|nr:hypothetical protein [Acidovorax sp. sif0732]